MMDRPELRGQADTLGDVPARSKVRAWRVRFRNGASVGPIYAKSATEALRIARQRHSWAGEGTAPTGASPEA